MNLPPKPANGKAHGKPKSERRGKWEYLSDSSPKDKPWDQHRHEADGVGDHLTSAGTERWIYRQGKRMEECAPSLGFAITPDKATGEARFKLAHAKFCRVRHCPICQWRRSLMWKGRFLNALPEVMEKQPKGEWLFLTLTARNVAITDLREELQEMGKAWHRLIKRKEMVGVAGWIRSTEITRGEDGSAHPHYHALLFVKPSYFKKHYITHERWRETWQEVMRLDYLPQVRVQKVRAKKADLEKHGSLKGAIAAAAAETLKYTVKPADMLKDRVWFLEMVRQTFRNRAIAAGGLLKDAIKEKDETQQDLLLADEEKPPEEVPQVVRSYDYNKQVMRYRSKRTG